MISYVYAGVHVQLARTTDLSFVMTREPYGVDAIFTTYDIKVKGFLSLSEGQFPGANGLSLSTANMINRVKAVLEKPRQAFEYRIGGEVIVSVPGGLDADLGPAPYPCRITEQGVNTGTFMVECGVRVSVIDCTPGCGLNDPVVSLRWTQTETFDQNWNSNLVTDGRVIVRSDLLRNADNFRSLATPPVLNDYIRTTSRYTLDPSGLKLDFHYEDQEVDRLPPFPATKAHGTYVVRSEKPGFKREGTVRIALEGQKGTDRKALLIKAIAMGYSKLNADRFLDKLPSGQDLPVPIIWGMFKEDLFEPKVEIEMTAMMSNIAKGGFVRGAGTNRFSGAAALIAGGAPGVGGVGPATLGFNLGSDLVGGTGFNPAAGALAAATGVGGAAKGAPASGIGGGAPAARGGGGATDAAAAAALIMPSVGQETFGLASNQPGIAPPDRKRIAGLLTAMFKDPCLCLESNATLTSNTGPRTNERNDNIVNPVPLDAGDTGGGGDFGTASTTELRSGSSPSVIQFQTLSSSLDSGWLEDTAPYDTYEIETTTTMDTGKVQMPGTGVGADGDVSFVATAHGGMMQVTTVWVAGRTCVQPVLPSFESPDPNVVPLWGAVVARDMFTSPDGYQVYMASGYYVHAVLRPKKYQIQPAVAPMFDAQLRSSAADGAGFWTEAATWVLQGDKGLAMTSETQPLVPDGVDPGRAPVPPPALATAQPGIDLSNFSGAELIRIGQTGQLPTPVGQGADPTHDFFNPPVRP